MIEFEQENIKKKRKETDILVEKYRPNSIKSMILPKRMRQYFETIVKEQNIPNLILYSSNPGSGKTTLAKALANDCGYEYEYINTSMDRGIDTLRTRIANFASVKSINGKKKVVILDEFDWASETLQAGLRGAIEEYYDRCRFIITANEINKIIDPIKSRCQMKNFEFGSETDKKELVPKIIKRIINISQREDIEIKKETVKSLVISHFPDIRHTIQLIDEYRRENSGIVDNNIFNFESISDELANLIISCKLKSVREYIANNNYKYDLLYRYLWDNVVPKLENIIKGSAMLAIAEYMDMSVRSIDKEITFIACVVSIMELIKEG